MGDFEDEGDRLDAIVSSQLPAVRAPLDHHDYAKLALEIARNINELEVVLRRWDITPEHYEKIKVNAFFSRALQQYTIEWNSAENVKQRLKLEAGAILEDAYPVLAARMHKTGEDLGKIAELAKMFSKTAGLDEDKAPGAPGEKFSITINLGEDTKLQFEKDVTPTTPGTTAAPVPPDRKRKAGRAAIPKITIEAGSSAPVGAVPKDN